MAANAATLLLGLLIFACVFSVAPAAEGPGGTAPPAGSGLPGIADGDDGDIVDLNDVAFGEVLEKHEFALVMLYNASCDRSKRYMIQLREAAAAMKAAGSAVVVGKVDVVRRAEVLQRAAVRTVVGEGELPLYLWADRGALQLCDEFSSEEIEAWVKRKTGSTLITMAPSSPSDLPTLASLLKDPPSVALALALVQHAQGAAAAVFKDASKDVEGVAFAITSDPAVAAALGWKGDVAGALAAKGKVGALVAVIKSKEETFVPFEGALTREAVAAFVRVNMLPLFVHFDDDAAEKFGKLTKWNIIIFSPRPAFADFERSLAPLAKQHKGKVHFAMVDSSDEEEAGQPMDYFGIREGETAVLGVFSDASQPDPEESKHRLEADPTPQNVKAFVEALVAGQLPVYYKSDPIPDKNDAAVKVVVSKTFQEMVMDDSKDVMLLLRYADECPSCEALLPYFTQLAEQLHHVPSVMFAHMDFATNEVLGLELESFPTVLLYPAHNKSNPVPVPGRVVRWRAMVETLRQHGGSGAELAEGLEGEVVETGPEYDPPAKKDTGAAAAKEEEAEEAEAEGEEEGEEGEEEVEEEGAEAAEERDEL